MRRDDWLPHQLPVGMTDDDFLMRFLSIFQTLADTVLQQIDTLPHMFDATVAPPEMVRAMSRWTGVDWNDSSLDEHLQRQIVLQYSELLQWRGTRRGLERLLRLIGGGEVVVDDSGEVVPEGESSGAAPHVHITVESTGWARPDDLVRIVRDELPASVTFELFVGTDQLWPPTDHGAGGEQRETQEVS